MRRLVLVAAAVILAACGSAPGHAQALTLSFAKGAVYHYSLHVSGNATLGAGAFSQAIKADIKASETVTVDTVYADGSADLSLTTSNLTVSTTYGGTTNTTTTTTPGKPATVKVGPNGHLLSFNGSALGSSPLGSFAGSGLGFAALPDKAVKAGDSWSSSYDQAMPSGAGSIHIVANSKYVRDESFHNVNAAVVETKSTITFSITQLNMKGMPEPLPVQLPGAAAGTAPGAALPIGGGTIKGTVTTDVTSWVDPGAHRILKSVSSATLDATATMTGGVQPQASSPMMIGPITVKGSLNIDVEPA